MRSGGCFFSLLLLSRRCSGGDLPVPGQFSLPPAVTIRRRCANGATITGGWINGGYISPDQRGDAVRFGTLIHYWIPFGISLTSIYD
jgi:hypothetical protein